MLQREGSKVNSGQLGLPESRVRACVRACMRVCLFVSVCLYKAMPVRHGERPLTPR